MNKVRIENIRRGEDERFDFIYARVVNAENGELEIAATIDYCLKQCQLYGWDIVNAKEALYELSATKLY